MNNFSKPTNWQTVTLETLVADTQLGTTERGEDEGGSSIDLIKMGNLTWGGLALVEVERVSLRKLNGQADLLQVGDLLFNTRNSADLVGKSAIWRDSNIQATFDNNINRIRLLDFAHPEFFGAYLNTGGGKKSVQSLAVGSTSVAAIYWKDLRKLKVPLPPLPEQRKIAEILRTWDEAIEKLEALRAANLQRRIWMRTHLFTGRARLLGYTGEWREVALGEVLTEHGLQGTGAEEVFSVSVHKGLINQIEHLGRSFAAAETGHYNRVLPGDIVYTKSPTGNFPLGIIKQSKISAEVIVSPLYGVFTPATRALGVILDALFESPIAVRNYLHPLVQKGAKNTIAITNRRFLEGKLRLPKDHAEQSAIAEVVEVSQAELTAIEAEIEALTCQKRGLMQKLLTGEWRVAV
ncbi:restriction endonuclease subunit S [Pseudogemmobacter humi]|uniref:EcoKI restriction-modification system protein HsdS n=1 Tax=Pseudogemmobacter humi TaxID=2483812 RepID=A0A3P5WRI6_9RHOB|nr:restriction endonuclease subunit S [Pseudogemmobacter humi]VDC21770.1 EcoKI restriction-modification system protein HsdS [Pseudogemmobacter humi]